jgi:branched-chain amino acid transport system ATP-binding protein
MSDATAPAIEAIDVEVTFGALRALTGVSLHVRPGTVHGLIGPNGSGKSTLLHVLAGKQRPDHGSVAMNGVDVTAATPAQRSRRGLSIKFQLARVYPDLTVADNMLIALQAHQSLGKLLLSRTRSQLVEQTATRLDEVSLTGRGRELARSLSHGEQQWLEIAMARALDPSVLLLDEPTAGMSPQERRRTGAIIAAAGQHSGVLIVDHDIDFVKSLCTEITVLAQGAVVANGTPAAIEADPLVQEVFLTRV